MTRCVLLPSVQAVARSRHLQLNYPIRHGLIDNWNNMEKLWQRCIFDYLHAEPEDHYFLLVRRRGLRERAVVAFLLIPAMLCRRPSPCPCACAVFPYAPGACSYDCCVCVCVCVPADGASPQHTGEKGKGSVCVVSL